MAVIHLNQNAKAESSVKVSGNDAKKVSAILIDETKKNTEKNLNFLKSLNELRIKYECY